MGMQIKDSKTAVVEWSVSMRHCFRVVARVWPKYTDNDTPVITGAQETGHSKGSQHYGMKTGGYQSEAADFDSANLNEDNAQNLAFRLQSELGQAYQVLIAWKVGSIIYYDRKRAFEVARKTEAIITVSHIHIEHDPRK